MPVLFVLFLIFIVVKDIGGGDVGVGVHRILVTILVIFLIAVVVVILLNLERILRWYYQLTPHPAKSMVEAALEKGVELDENAFAQIMRPIPGGKIEQEVRAEQARKLAVRAHRHAESMRVEAERVATEARRVADFSRAQDELAAAAFAHEKAKARLDALRKRVG